MRIQITNPAGGTFLGAAKGWLRQLQLQRADLRLPMLEKIMRVDGFRILVRASEWGDLIWIAGGFPLDHIMLTNHLSASTYDWNGDALHTIPNPASATVADIVPIYNTRCQVQEYNSFTFGTAWTPEVIGTTPFTFLGGMNSHELALFEGPDGIYGRIAGEIGHIADTKDDFFPEYASVVGPFFGLPSKKADETPWNLFNGIYLRALNVATQKVLPAWFWTPSFLTVQHQDPALFRGWYYGFYSDKGPILQYTNTRPGAEGDYYTQPLESLKVSFRGLLDTRYQSALGLYQYGWAELVTEVDGEDKNDLFFYFQKDMLEIPPNNTASYVFSNATNPYDDTFWVGSAFDGYPLGFKVELDQSLERESISVDFWNLQVWTDPSALDAQQDTGVGAVVIYPTTAGASTRSAKVYRYAGAAALIFETDNYHSHSYSRDGSTLAVFSGTTVIETVTVYDLFGRRNNETEQHESGYIGAGATLIRDEGVLAAVAATTGCVIPSRAAGFDAGTELLVLPYDLATAVPDATPEVDYTEYLPSMSTMEINKLGTRSPIFHNVICKNGVDAEFGISIDPCFESVVLQEDPNQPTKLEKLIGRWKELGSDQGVVRGDYSGEIPNIRFHGDTDHSGTDLLYTSTLAEMVIEFSALRQEYIVRGNLGPAPIEGLDDEGNPIYACDGTAVLTAQSPCQTAELDLSIEIEPLVLIPPSLYNAGEEAYDPVQLGYFFEATGGLPPYLFAFPGVDQSTGEVLDIDECIIISDPRITGEASVTDSCANTDTAVILIDRASLILTGTDTPIVGSVYTAGGSAGPFTYGFNKGSISAEGEILSIEPCTVLGAPRVGIVSVSDSCGNVASLDVRLPGGHWQQISVEYQGSKCLTPLSASYSPVYYFGNYRSQIQYTYGYENDNCGDCTWRPAEAFIPDVYCKDPWKDEPCTPPVTANVLCQVLPRSGPDLVYVIGYQEIQEWVC